jgi:bifunctional non-homologous end joining protein LigD
LRRQSTCFQRIPAIRPDHYTIENLPRRLARIGADPWEGFFEVRQSLTKGMKEELELGGG